MNLYHISNERRRKLFDLLQYNAFPANDNLPEPDFQELQTASYHVAHPSSCYLIAQRMVEMALSCSSRPDELLPNIPSFLPTTTGGTGAEYRRTACWNIVAEARIPANWPVDAILTIFAQ